MGLHLISHHLCPYVQRAVISLTEKGVPYQRTGVDLANKPDWFLAISPLGKTPVLVVDDVPIFESDVILEYLEETQPHPLHPADALTRARDRAWMAFGSAVLSDIAGLYNAPDGERFAATSRRLRDRFRRLESELGDGPFFRGPGFSLVDAVFGPVFRYFAVFDRIKDFGIMANFPKVADWRATLAQRPSIRAAVAPDYPARLEAFLRQRGSYLSSLMKPVWPADRTLLPDTLSGLRAPACQRPHTTR